MSGEKQAEEAIVVSGVSEQGDDGAGGKVEDSTAEDINSGDASDGFSMKSFLWHGGSAWDAWFSCASNQVMIHIYFGFSYKLAFCCFLRASF